jgi:phage terminase Nu1 subunit (DNA packaging protein)
VRSSAGWSTTASAKYWRTDDDAGGVLNLEAERARLTKAQADRQELALARERDQLVPIALIEKTASFLVQNSRASLLSLPSRVAALVPDNDRKKVFSESQSIIFKSLEELARLTLPDEIFEQDDDDDTQGGDDGE